jgi:hypothetical protein
MLQRSSAIRCEIARDGTFSATEALFRPAISYRKHCDRQAGRQAGRQASRQASRQAGRQAGRQAQVYWVPLTTTTTRVLRNATGPRVPSLARVVDHRLPVGIYPRTSLGKVWLRHISIPVLLAERVVETFAHCAVWSTTALKSLCWVTSCVM